jgi:hypothetical protein
LLQVEKKTCIKVRGTNLKTSMKNRNTNFSCSFFPNIKNEHIPMLMMKTMTNSNKTGLKTPKHTKIKHEQQEEV